MRKWKKVLPQLIGFCVLTFLITVPVSAGVYDSVTNTKSAVQNISISSFRNAELKAAYLHDLDGIDTILIIAEDETETANKNQLYQDALNTVNSLIAKTDGCDTNGTPDTEDWISICTDSSAVYTALNQLAADISMLIQ